MNKNSLLGGMGPVEVGGRECLRHQMGPLWPPPLRNQKLWRKPKQWWGTLAPKPSGSDGNDSKPSGSFSS